MNIPGLGAVSSNAALGWDEEHTLGARFQDAEFVELNGSILSE